MQIIFNSDFNYVLFFIFAMNASLELLVPTDKVLAWVKT
jgi:hypothetical protein